MSFHGQAVIAAISVIDILALTAVFLWVNGKSRRGTFFSVRVEPGFATSENGRAILRNFRRRAWLLALLVSVIYAPSFGFGRPTASVLRFVGYILIIVGDFIIFFLASKETRAKALPQREPLSRTATLFTAEEERSFGLTIIDWLGVVLPVIFPAATAILFGLYWPQIPADKRRVLILVGIAAPASMVSAFSYFALRFRARSRDWNPDPRASRKYRTMLGLVATSWPTFLSFVICFVCVSYAVPLKEAIQWWLVEVFLWALLLGIPVQFFGFFGILWWLRRNVSAESGDPMPDRCWKWGYFYFNSEDPALVVPYRSGIRFCYNYARRPVWWFVLGPMIVSISALLLAPRLGPRLGVETRRAAQGTTQPTELSGQRRTVISPVASPNKTKPNFKDGLTYVWIPPGAFEMGCSSDDSECDSTRYPHESERPAHAVTITKGFWIGQTPVTQAAYTKVTGANPSYFKGDQLPVESVSWDDAHSFCGRVDMRLPTEAEYEYAGRGGNTNARYGPADQIAWYSANSGGTTHEVAQKLPNDYGLYDMMGNVWEWVADWYGPYNAASLVDPKGPPTATPICFLKFFFCNQDRVLRGSSWNVAPFFARASARGGGRPDFRGDETHGFRCAVN